MLCTVQPICRRGVRPSVCPSVCLLRLCTVSKRVNVFLNSVGVGCDRFTAGDTVVVRTARRMVQSGHRWHWQRSVAEHWSVDSIHRRRPVHAQRHGRRSTVFRRHRTHSVIGAAPLHRHRDTAAARRPVIYRPSRPCRLDVRQATVHLEPASSRILQPRPHSSNVDRTPKATLSATRYRYSAALCRISNKNRSALLTKRTVNPLECRVNYSVTSNNMKLVHWPFMGGLLHLVRRGEDWAGPQSAPCRPLLAV